MGLEKDSFREEYRFGVLNSERRHVRRMVTMGSAIGLVGRLSVVLV